jgi:hypothetical protein
MLENARQGGYMNMKVTFETPRKTKPPFKPGNDSDKLKRGSTRAMLGIHGSHK